MWQCRPADALNADAGPLMVWESLSCWSGAVPFTSFRVGPAPFRSGLRPSVADSLPIFLDPTRSCTLALRI